MIGGCRPGYSRNLSSYRRRKGQGLSRQHCGPHLNPLPQGEENRFFFDRCAYRRRQECQFESRLKNFAAIALIALFATKTAAESAPSAKEILTTVRMQQALQQIDLQGQLRQEATVVPFRLTQTGPLIKYSFANPPGALQLRLGENDSRLEELSESGAEKITPAQFDHKVRGTAITYEDLALKFLYWPDARVLGEEPVRSRRCWKLELRSPSHDSQYSNVLLWIDKNSGALMEMEGYDWQGRLLKRFEVISAQKIEGRWFLKQMRIEQMDPATHKAESRTYLEIKK